MNITKKSDKIKASVVEKIRKGYSFMGEKKKRPFYDDDGNVMMKDSIDIGLTIDERIADGYYYAKTVRLLKKLLENPELLEMPLGEKTEY